MKTSNKYKKLILRVRAAVKSARIPRSFSKKKNNVFSNEQHITMYVLMIKEDKAYRDMPDFLELLKKVLRLPRIPNFTTINKFALRIKSWWIERLIAEIVGSVKLEDPVICGIDGTGFSLNNRSKYFCTIAGERREFLQFNACTENKHRLIVACKIRRKKRNENIDVPCLMRKSKQLRISHFVADKQYDSERNHELAEKYGAEFIAPLRRKTDKYHRVGGVHRKRLFKYFPSEIYKQRAGICETMNSSIKRRYGETIYAKTFRAQKNELLGKVLVYDSEKVIEISKINVYFLQDSDL